MGVEKETLVGKKELETESEDEGGKKVLDRVHVDEDKMESRISRGDHVLLQCGKQQTGVEGILRGIIEEGIIGHCNDATVKRIEEGVHQDHHGRHHQIDDIVAVVSRNARTRNDETNGDDTIQDSQQSLGKLL